MTSVDERAVEHRSKTPVPPLDSMTIRALRTLYQTGGWTPREVHEHLPNAAELYRGKIIGKNDSLMGPVTVLLYKGKVAAYGNGYMGPSVTTLIDDTYLRLCLRDFGWTVLRKRHYGRVRDVGLTERLTLIDQGGVHAYAIGKVTDGGMPQASLKAIVNRYRSTLLFEGRTLVVFTPSSKRGQELARRHNAVLEVLPYLPRMTFTSSDISTPRRAP